MTDQAPASIATKKTPHLPCSVAFAHFVSNGAAGYGGMTQFIEADLSHLESLHCARRFMSLMPSMTAAAERPEEALLTRLSIGLRAVAGDDEFVSMLIALAVLGSKGGSGWLNEYDEVTKRARSADVSSDDIRYVEGLAQRNAVGNVIRAAVDAIFTAAGATPVDALPNSFRLHHQPIHQDHKRRNS